MSTKIFYAYRVPKTIDILSFLNEMTDYHTDRIANDGELLELIHILAFSDARGRDEFISKSALDSNEKGDVDVYYLKMWLEENKNKNKHLYIDVDFEVSVFYDNDYWYLKFFPNMGAEYDTIKHFEDRMEDYHYQNSTDPPEDIPYGEYESRDDKWDELLEYTGGNFSKGLLYNIFTAEDFVDLLTKYYYTGEKDLYKHLTYKFPQIKFK
jgi:hypothetical protein